MPNPRVPSSSPHNHKRVVLDRRHLNALRQRRDAPGALAPRFQARRDALMRAALTRADAGKPVAYRTVRRLAAFYGITADTLIDTQPWRDSRATDSCIETPGLEHLQCRAVLEAVRTTGCGRLVDVHGAAGSGKSRLLGACVSDARGAGYTCAVLHEAPPDAPTPPAPLHSVTALMLAVLGLDSIAHLDQARLAPLVRERCWTLGLPLAHIDACLSLLEGARRWPLPAVHLLQTAALCALIQHCARLQPLLIAIDGIGSAGWQLAMMLNVLVPATLEFPVLWLIATGQRPLSTQPARTPRLDALARTTLHLAAPPVRRDRADVASVHRLARIVSAHPTARPGRDPLAAALGAHRHV